MNDFSPDNSNGLVAAALKSYLGPYEAWNFGIGRPYAFSAYRREDIKFLTALAEHPSPKTAEAVTGAGNVPERRMWFPTMWGRSDNVPLRFWPIVVENRSRKEITLEGLGAGLREVLPAEGIDKSRFRLAFPVEPSAMHEGAGTCPAEPEWSPDPKVSGGCPPGKTINVLAVIDDGIPFAHRNFRSADGERSRMEFCWLQSAAKNPASDDASVLFGQEYTRKEIEALIRNHDDEDALYATAGASSDQFGSGAAINRIATHGAHVMDIAAGCDPNKSEAPAEETRLIAVQLPNTYPWDTSSFGKDMYMLSAVHYILERAERIGAGYGVNNIRVTINCSYGFSAGPHNGTSVLEAAIDEVVRERRKLGRPTAVVLPSGNTFQDRLHGEVTSNDFKKGEFEFMWRVQPTDRTSNYLEIWFPEGLDPGDYSVGIEDPFKSANAEMLLKPDPDYQDGDPRNFQVIQLDNQAGKVVVGQLSLDNYRSNNRWRVLVALAPTEPDEPDLPAAPSGDWKITLKRGADAAQDHLPIYIWIQRDVDLEAFRKGNRQSYLSDPDYRTVDDRGGEAQSDGTDSHVRRFGSINGMAIGGTSLIVSGCMPSAEAQWDVEKPIASTFSAAGKIGSAGSVGKVDCTAPADRSSINPGIIGAGTRSGSYVMVQGTSVAAPLVARRLAEAFASRSEDEVRNAEADNYLSIIETIELPGLTGEERARLGGHLVL